MTTWRSYWLDMIDMMADEAKHEISKMAQEARREIRRKAEFPARSAGQKKRRKMEGCKNAKHHAQ